jgi:D-alanyl-lipoteichoic acid acyltransferase DltB (MBOAT superfamily)
MAVCGLWHGAGLVICRAWQSLKRPLPAALGWALTMAFVMAGWVLFRAADFHTAASVLYSLTGGTGFNGNVKDAGLTVVAAVVAVMVPSAHEIANLRPMSWPVVAVGAALLAAVCMLEAGNGPALNFIYFQF